MSAILRLGSVLESLMVEFAKTSCVEVAAKDLSSKTCVEVADGTNASTAGTTPRTAETPWLGRSGDAARQTSSPAGLARPGSNAGRQCNDSSRMVPPDEGAPRLSDEHHV